MITSLKDQIDFIKQLLELSRLDKSQEHATTILNDIASTLAAARFNEYAKGQSISKHEMFSFMKWFFHGQRKSLRYEDNVNAVDFASNVMNLLCEVSALGDSKLETLYKEYLNRQKAYFDQLSTENP